MGAFMPNYEETKVVGASVARLRTDAGISQSKLKEKTGLDQSRISRIENGEVATTSDIDRVLDALHALGVEAAGAFKVFARRKWQFIEPPSFWNPERACLEVAEETLGEV